VPVSENRGLVDHVVRNRGAWNARAAEDEEPGRRRWARDEPAWGIWSVPESQVGMFPTSVAGLDTVELGCGTGYVSAWLARRGARPVGVDNAPAQLDIARRLQVEFDLHFPLVCADAEEVPLCDRSFDLAVSEYGASIWCDPDRWIPEAARLLRPGGGLVFLVNGPFFVCCVPDEHDMPAGERLLRPYLGMHRIEWPGDESVEFHLAHGDMIRTLRSSGFTVDELVEVAVPDGSTTRFPWMTLEWTQRWPGEEVWKARLTESATGSGIRSWWPSAGGRGRDRR
jgi:SAM-dependent methyltransferase